MTAAKTLFLFEEKPEECYFFELEGDHSRFDEVYINGVGPKEKVARKKHEALSKELYALLYDDKGNARITEEKKLRAPSKDWTHFVKCGFIL